MNHRKKQNTNEVNRLLEQRYFQNKFLNEDTNYQVTPDMDDTSKKTIKAIEDGVPRELTPEEIKIIGEKPLSQDEAIAKLKELQNKLTK